jgi:hypothetical protein
MPATATTEQPTRPASPEWETMGTALRHRPILLLTRDLAGNFETPFVGRWSTSETCWVNAGSSTPQPVYPEFWCKIPPIEKETE